MALSIILVFILHFQFSVHLRPETQMQTPEVIQYYGYKCQTHSVITEDGYILNMHRIPSGRNFSRCFRKFPVLLLHGLLFSSYAWVGNTDKTSLGFLLADEGYDVWLGNVRGNSYSLKHVNLSYSDKKFWDFCFDQHGTIDVPTMVDYILNLTNQRSLLLVCHSMGCLNSIIMLSTKQEYKFKVRGIVALAPGWNSNHLGGFLLPFLIRLHTVIISVFNLFKMWSFPPVEEKNTGSFPCKDYAFFCFIFTQLVGGPNLFGFNLNRLDVMLHNFPEITSVRNLQHLAQWFSTKENATMFDFEDYAINTIHYKQATPLRYNFRTADVPIAVLWAVNDYLADPRDVMNRVEVLPRVKLLYQVQDAKFNHFSFLWGLNVKTLVYDKTIELVKTFTRRCFQ